MTHLSEWLDAAEANAHRKVTLGQPVVRELDRLLANDRANLVRAVAALRAVLDSHSPFEEDCLEWDCGSGECQHDEDPCPTAKVTLCEACYRLATDAWPYYGENGCGEVLYPCPTVKAIAETLGVEL